ncbi:hypothetical protein TNCV_1044961 [Trichonephila clavipes]|nr:hypothetical protein TNCV_1044961 [Trichonephila clavipes]
MKSWGPPNHDSTPGYSWNKTHVVYLISACKAFARGGHAVVPKGSLWQIRGQCCQVSSLSPDGREDSPCRRDDAVKSVVALKQHSYQGIQCRALSVEPIRDFI